MLKVDIRIGKARIILEGTSEEVDSILERHWEPHAENLILHDARGSNSSEENENSSKEAKGKTKPRARKPSSSKAATKGSEESQKLEEELANKIKSDNNFPSINSKFITGKATVLDRCKLVIYFSEQPLTSGNIQRVLTRLNIKTSLPTVSRTLSGKSADFITSGNPPEYKFTATARSDFETRLMDSGE